jgi:ferrous iron transport protein A
MSLNYSPCPGRLAVNDIIPLTLLPDGQSANVSQVTGRPDQVHRLEELGLRGGAMVEMVQSGSPCIVRLSGHKLCFRADDLLRVLVRRGALT